MSSQEESLSQETPRIAIGEVAARAGVSISTVSRVLNNKGRISLETRDKVLEIARELGYTRSRQLHSTPDEQHRLISVTSLSMRGGYYAEIIAGITEGLHAHNARLLVCPLENRHNCRQSLLERILHQETDGALLVGTGDSNEELQTAWKNGYPLVIVDPFQDVPPDIPVVAGANWAGAREATTHLITLGHTRIGAITGPRDRRSEQDRLAGLQSALLAADLPIIPELIYEADYDQRHLTSAERSIQQGHQAALALLTLPYPPTAILAFDDAMAIGILHASHELGVSVPDDLSLVCFDNMQWARATLPRLTAIRQPLFEMGRMAADMLYWLIEQRPLEVRRVELSTQLVIEGSSAPPRIH